jgi:hypothetical protein
VRLPRRVLSTACEASRMLVEIALVSRKDGRFPYPMPGIVLACLKMRSVEILGGLILMLLVASGRFGV